ncbi:hypothetical protein PFISCL1PPCAC_26290, partial [Pristionchus fissidentatus]
TAALAAAQYYGYSESAEHGRQTIFRLKTVFWDKKKRQIDDHIDPDHIDDDYIDLEEGTGLHNEVSGLPEPAAQHSGSEFRRTGFPAPTT